MLSWLGKSKTGVNIDDLIARKKYSQAIEAMRALFQRRTPAAAERHRFAEVLILADRWPEAVPVLLGLADEHVRFGFLDKAREALRRVEDLEAGRSDVALRLLEITRLEEAVGQDETEGRHEIAGREEREGEGPLQLEDTWFDEEEPEAPAEGGVEPHALAVETELDPEEMELEPVETELDPVEMEPFEEAVEIGEEPVEVDSGSLAEIAAQVIEAAVDPAVSPAGTGGRDAGQERSVLDLVRGLARRAHLESAKTGRPVLAAAFFHGLGDEQVRPLLPGLHRRFRAAGHVILTEGERGDSVFLVASGTAKVLVRSPHGRHFEVDRISTLGFFGEVAALSGRPREATLVAATTLSLLEIEKAVLDALVLCRPEARQLLEEACVARAMSPAAAAVRSVPEDVEVERAAVALTAHFGESRWSVRMRLRLADVMLQAGNEKDALAILTGVAEDLAAAGRADKAIAVLKKIQQIANRSVGELCLAPLSKAPPALVEEPREPAARRQEPPQQAFRGWLLNVVEDLKTAAGEGPVAARLDRSPLGRPTTAN